tara:strand:+ start:2708 stop:3091 length:384 start_codon:yes stop_codon:yes gene_type:complete
MSTLNVTNAQITTLKDASGGNSNTPAAINSGIAKYWCTFQGSGTAAILDSFNSAGFSDSGTGIYALTIDTDFDSANFVATGSVTNSTRGVVAIDGMATGGFNVNTREGHSGTATDYGLVSVVAFGDQ